MRLRWRRILGSVAGAAVGLPAVFLLGWRATLPEPPPPAARAAGSEPCRADEVLVKGAPLHEEHEDATLEDIGVGEADALATQVVLAAARCATLAPIPTEHVWDGFALAQHAVRWIARNERGAVAVDHLLDVWELAIDQAHRGTLIDGFVGSGVARAAYEELDRLLVEEPLALTPGERREARDRLLVLAAAAPDWAAIAVHEEHSIWQMAGWSLGAPAMWPYLLTLPKVVVDARYNGHVLVPKLEADLRTNRLEAAVLAAAFELEGGCGEVPAAVGVAREVGLDLDWLAGRCAVVGTAGDEVRLATGR